MKFVTAHISWCHRWSPFDCTHKPFVSFHLIFWLHFFGMTLFRIYDPSYITSCTKGEDESILGKDSLVPLSCHLPSHLEYVFLFSTGSLQRNSSPVNFWSKSNHLTSTGVMGDNSNWQPCLLSGKILELFIINEPTNGSTFIFSVIVDVLETIVLATMISCSFEATCKLSCLWMLLTGGN